MVDFNHSYLGRQSLQYLGSRAATPPNLVRLKRNPTTQDYKEFIIGDLWLNESTNDLWYLANLTGNVATWIQLAGGAGVLQSLTGDVGGAVSPNVSNTIFVLGGPGVQTNGNPATNTITIDITDPIATQYDADTGSATPSSGVLNIVGTGGISTTGAGNTITIEDGGLLANQYTADIGTAIPSGNNLNVLGGFGIQTTGSGDTLQINQVTVNSQFFAYVSAPVANVSGANTTYTVIYDFEVYDDNNDYDNTTGIFTAPVNGIYVFNGAVTMENLIPANDIGFLRFRLTGSFTNNVNLVRENYGAARDSSNVFRENGACVVKLQAGDTVRFDLNIGGNAIDNVGIRVTDFAQNTFAGALLRQIY